MRISETVRVGGGADRARDQVAARAGRRVAERIVPVFRGERILAVRALRLLAMVNDQYRKSGAPPLQVSRLPGNLLNAKN